MSESQKEPIQDDDLSNSYHSFHSLTGEVPESVQGNMKVVERKISGELLHSRKRFFAAYIVLSVVGYLFSLSLCSQNSIALTALSLDTAALLHRLPDPLCPIVCGLFFTLVPALCLLVFLDRFQMRRLVRELWWLPVLTALLTCLLMVFLPGAFQHQGMHMHHEGVRHTQGDALWLFLWTLAAISIPGVGAFVLNRRFSRHTTQSGI